MKEEHSSALQNEIIMPKTHREFSISKTNNRVLHRSSVRDLRLFLTS